ncbi:MAG: ATP-binding cassette domain-containing protein [Chloroflexota bacterium]|nr:MAG: ATP-binding cassette domain-containing protein [Chloroflexota bacterium]
MDIIQVDHLVKRYGSFTAVDGVSFAVQAGEVFGFLGPNGAGKTTTISVLCTLLRLTEGRVLVNGFDVVRQSDDVRRSIGLIFQDPSLDTNLTAQENLDFHAFVYNVPSRESRARQEELLKMVELWDRRKALVKTFSGGMKRRLEIARGLLHRPKVLFLDEPTLGLDPQTRRHIWQYILGLREKEGITIFLTTHYMDEAENCSRIAIIDHGKIAALDTPAQLKAKVGGDIITLRTTDNQRAGAELRERFGLEAVSQDGMLRLEVPKGDEFIPQLVQNLSGPILAINMSRPTLDDVFLKLTGRAIREAEANGMKDAMRVGTRMWERGRR